MPSSSNSKVSNCIHVDTVGDVSWEQLKQKQGVEECDSCDAHPPHLWLCLYKDCHYVGCGEKVADHSLHHYKERNHSLTINLMTLRIWCNSCECEVFPDHNNPPFYISGNSQTTPINTTKSGDNSNDSSPQRSFSNYEDSESDLDDETIKPRGLTGLQNLGNTCYMNAALQALSNCPPLTRFFLDCSGCVRPEKTPHLSRNYLRLITELWHKKRPSYVVPSGVVNGIKVVHPMFRGCTQQDTQEFLRCFMDQLHEELKQPICDSEEEEDITDNTQLPVNYSTTTTSKERKPSIDSGSSQSDCEYETCDSGLSSERNSGDHNFSEDEGSDGNEITRQNLNKHGRDKNRHNVRSVYDNSDISVANVKDTKETANLLAKGQSELRRKHLNKSESGEFIDAVSDLGSSTSSLRSSKASIIGKQTQHGAGGDKCQSVKPHHQPNTTSKGKRKMNIQYQSVISDTFDGRILSSVQCLTCERISTTKETFQDLSLPIPSRDHLQLLHTSQSGLSGAVVPKGGACGEVNPGWITWVLSWMKSFFTGPTISLQDCLAAFFSADELKGDNMYSCEKCKKLRNGLKYSRVLELPEILSIHLKRFRHEFYSSKIGAYVAFPLEGLDMKHYLHKDCNNEVTTYDLTAVICHHGTAGGGHYTAYCLNYINEKWYEFDDQVVTEVDIQQVVNCEAYVLFYRKRNDKMHALRQKAMELMEAKEPSLMQFFVSKQWISKFNTFAEPGPITNNDFLCSHGGVPPNLVDHVEDLVVPLSQSMWEYLYNRFEGGPVCNRLYACQTCQLELDNIRLRQKTEMDTFIQLNEEFKAEDNPSVIYAISMSWFKDWENFVRDRTDCPPGPIDNSRITVMKNGVQTLKQTSDHGQLSGETWQYLFKIYGGGPELILKQSHPVVTTTLLSQATSSQSTFTQAATPSPPAPTSLPKPTPTPVATVAENSPDSSGSSSSQATVVEASRSTPVQSIEEEPSADGQPSENKV